MLLATCYDRTSTSGDCPLTVMDSSTPASFSVTATGTAPLSYQWRWNGSDLTGQTHTNLAFGAVQPADTGNYTVVVTNLSGSVTSALTKTVCPERRFSSPRKPE